MYELHATWQKAQQGGGNFWVKVRLRCENSEFFRLPSDREKYSQIWLKEHKTLDDLVREYGLQAIEDIDEFNAMNDLTISTQKILKLITDHVRFSTLIKMMHSTLNDG